MVINIKN